MNIIEDIKKFNLHYFDELFLLDRALGGILFHDPEHTISYNIAVRAKEGNLKAIELCKMLNILSPDHCANALANESGSKWKEYIAEEEN